MELDNIIAEDNDIDFINLSLFEVTPPPDKTTTPIPATFLPNLDDSSVSTFGLRKGASKQAYVSNDIVLAADHSIVLQVTIESRVSKMELSFSSMKNHFTRLC